MASKKLPPLVLFRVLILPAAMLFTVTFYLTHQSALELFPENETFFDLTAQSDGNFEDGNSTTSIDTANKHLSFHYTLGSLSESPYAMLIFHAHELFRSINLKQYDYLDIQLHPDESDDFIVTLYTYIPGISNEEDSDTHRPYSIICRPQETEKQYRLYLKDFATPKWWYTLMNLRHEDLPTPSFEKITHLSISNAIDKKNVPLRITIEHIRFVDSKLISILMSSLMAVLYTLFYFIITEQIRIRKNRKIKQRLYHPNSKESYNDEEKEKLLNYLVENFSDPLLTLEKIEKQTGLNQFQVSEIISDTYKMRYKQYINHIRIEEAKKLLIETDTPISAIAEKVGYCYSNSFARAFRQSEDITPNQYRKEHQKQ